MVELLVPAGNLECLRAAVANGADAVYLGLNAFNARMSAENFNAENIKAVIDFCHSNNVLVYVVMNTLVKNSEMEDYIKQAVIVDNSGADAIIIQDRCLIEVLKKNIK